MKVVLYDGYLDTFTNSSASVVLDNTTSLED